MNAITNTQMISNKNETHKAGKLAIPNVYFRGVNRVQINRFKAYTLILSNRLNSKWNITEDVKSANVLVDWVKDKKNH